MYLSVFVSPLFLKFQDRTSPKRFELSSSNLVWWFVMMICCYTLCFAVLARVSPFKLAFCLFGQRPRGPEGDHGQTDRRTDEHTDGKSPHSIGPLAKKAKRELKRRYTS